MVHSDVNSRGFKRHRRKDTTDQLNRVLFPQIVAGELDYPAKYNSNLTLPIGE